LTDLVPPFPPRPAAVLPPLRLLRAARRNLLSIWTTEAFDRHYFSVRLLAGRVHVCNSPDTVKYVLNTRNAHFERKSPQMRHALRPLVGDGLFISDGPTWRSRRPAVAAAAHGSRLPMFAPVMVEAATETAGRGAALPPGRTVDVLSEMALLTSEIITRTMFGRALGARHARSIVDSFDAYQRRVGQMDLPSLLGLPDWLPRLRGAAERRAARDLRAVFADVLRRSRAAEEPSLVALLRRADAGGAALDDEALLDEAAVIFLAGHETTANTLAWAWFLLSEAPPAEARLHAELDAVLNGRPPSLADVPRLPFCRAVIEETMRLYPPVPILSRQATCDETIRRRPVRRGELVLVVPWLLHRHQRLWDSPDHFDPDRFLPGRARHDRYSYLPFGAGPRVCAGASFGLTEAVLCLATLAQRFRPRLVPGTVVEPVARLALRPRDGMPMTIHPRQPGEALFQAVA
jgi:cytochrome P450